MFVVTAFFVCFGREVKHVITVVLISISLVICGGAMGKMGNSIKSLPDLAEQHKVLIKWATEQS